MRIARIKLERYCIIKNDQGLVRSKSSLSLTRKYNLNQIRIHHIQHLKYKFHIIKEPPFISSTLKSLDFNNQTVASSNKLSNSKHV